MARTAAPVAPGTDPAASATTDTGADSAATKGTEANVPMTVEQLQAIVAAQAKQMDEMRNMMGQMVRRQEASRPEPVKLPSMAEVLKGGKPESPVLTSDGWYVPAVLPSQRQVG